MRMEPAWIDAHGIESRGRDCLASMGIYLFNRETLVELLTETDYRDFGQRDLSGRRPHVAACRCTCSTATGKTSARSARSTRRTCAWPPPTGRSTWRRPMAPIYSRARFLPPSRIDGATIRHSLIADGCAIEDGAVIENSVIGVRCRIGRNVTIRNSMLMGDDNYETPSRRAQADAAGKPRLGIGAGTVIDGAIIDKNCRIGRNVRVANDRNIESTEDTPEESLEVVIRDRVVCVQRGAILRDNWCLEPGT